MTREKEKGIFINVFTKDHDNKNLLKKIEIKIHA